MRKDESNLWARIKGNMPVATYPGLRLERIEAIINPGIPDLHCVARGRTSWIELKFVKNLPQKQFSAVLANPWQKLSQDQKNWHMDYRRCGGRVATLIGVGSYDYILMDGSYSDSINDMSWPLMHKSASIVGNRADFFSELYDWLQGKF